MEFWGVEVPSGKPIPCKPGPALYVHITQAAIGDSKNAKSNDRIILKVKVGTNEVVVGTLSQGNCDQTALDLIFEKDFVLSHTGSGSVYFCGYKTDAARDEDMSLKTVARGLNVLLGGLSAVSIVVILCLGVLRRIKYGPA